ncbi:hypothetical protein Taro_022788 [Colocasia esculenta]|uniref:Uncharacterized protein n=1 Tax=Colocasia esculenta TaxID=4460 RepID=A0A843VFG6_COLES|nr:hypothetical protein [Colocasia esculenta]
MSSNLDNELGSAKRVYEVATAYFWAFLRKSSTQRSITGFGEESSSWAISSFSGALGMNDIDCLGSGRRHLGVKPRPLSQCQRPDMDANTNSGVQRYGRQSLWPACAAELQASETRKANHWGMSPNGSEGCPITLVDPASYCDKKEAGAKEKASPSSPCCGAHPRTRRKVILEAILQLLGTAQGGLHRALDPLEEFVKGK